MQNPPPPPEILSDSIHASCRHRLSAIYNLFSTGRLENKKYARFVDMLKIFLYRYVDISRV